LASPQPQKPGPGAIHWRVEFLSLASAERRYECGRGGTSERVTGGFLWIEGEEAFIARRVGKAGGEREIITDPSCRQTDSIPMRLLQRGAGFFLLSEPFSSPLPSGRISGKRVFFPHNAGERSQNGTRIFPLNLAGTAGSLKR